MFKKKFLALSLTKTGGGPDLVPWPKPTGRWSSQSPWFPSKKSISVTCDIWGIVRDFLQKLDFRD